MPKNYTLMEKYFFEVPIYRCSVEKHTQEQEYSKNKRLQALIDIHGESVKSSHSYRWTKSDFDTNHWYPWRYNEIIGWLRLYTLSNQVRGDLWFINAKRIRSDLKEKRNHFVGKAFEKTILPSYSSSKIFEIICKELEYQSKDYPIKGRFMDTELFYQIGKYVDWKKLFYFN